MPPLTNCKIPLSTLTRSSKKNQAYLKTDSLTMPVLTTICNASSSWKCYIIKTDCWKMAFNNSSFIFNIFPVGNFSILEGEQPDGDVWASLQDQKAGFTKMNAVGKQTLGPIFLWIQNCTTEEENAFGTFSCHSLCAQ